MTEDEVSVQKAARALVSFAKELGLTDARIEELVQEALLTHEERAAARRK